MMEEQESARAAAPLRDYVYFRDAAMCRWRVTEREAARDPGARAAHCLIFSCDQAVRRVWDYPSTWRELSAEALTEVSWRR